LPTALIVFLVGVVIAFVRDPCIWGSLTLGPSTPQLLSISWSDWKTGFVKGAIPQIPLSILNSVIAVCKLSNDLFPDKIAVTPTAVSTSVGLMNMVGCWFGAMPVCHGAGGLAGQTRFGARSGAAVVLLGTAKIALGLLVGSSLVEVLSAFPIALLGVLLLFAGVELAMACRHQSTRADAFVMITCTVVSLGSDAALGFGSGLMLYILLKLRDISPALWWSSFRDALLLAPAPATPPGYSEIPSSSSAASPA
jgi:MFS superfamily sulfate permease-like transporter